MKKVLVKVAYEISIEEIGDVEEFFNYVEEVIPVTQNKSIEIVTIV